MVELEQCIDEVDRLVGLEYASALPPVAWRELGVALESAAKSDAHAERIITEFLRSSPKVPTPYELIQFAATVPEEAASARVACTECSDCSGTGFRIIERNGVTGAARCSCGGVPPGNAARPMPGLTLAFEPPAPRTRRAAENHTPRAAPPPPVPVKRITQVDIERALDAKRKAAGE